MLVRLSFVPSPVLSGSKIEAPTRFQKTLEAGHLPEPAVGNTIRFLNKLEVKNRKLAGVPDLLDLINDTRDWSRFFVPQAARR